MKPYTPQVYDEVVTDAHYLPLPTTYILYVMGDEGIVRWASGPVKADLETMARTMLNGWWIAEDKTL